MNATPFRCVTTPHTSRSKGACCMVWGIGWVLTPVTLRARTFHKKSPFTWTINEKGPWDSHTPKYSSLIWTARTKRGMRTRGYIKELSHALIDGGWSSVSTGTYGWWLFWEGISTIFPSPFSREIIEVTRLEKSRYHPLNPLMGPLISTII